MMSARSCASSISTWNPSSFERRGSANWYEAMSSSCVTKGGSSRVRRRGRFNLVFARHQQPQQLADRRFRYGVDKHETARAFEGGEAGVTAVFVKVLLADRLATLDESGDDLAPALIRQANDRD